MFANFSGLRLNWIKVSVPLVSTKLRRDPYLVFPISFSLLNKQWKIDIEQMEIYVHLKAVKAGCIMSFNEHRLGLSKSYPLVSPLFY